MLIFVSIGLYGGNNVFAINDGDVRCFHLKYIVPTGTDRTMHNPSMIPSEGTDTVYTNRVCADNEKIYAEKSSDVTRFEVQGNNVCLRVGGQVKQCEVVENNGTVHPLDGSLSTAMYELGKNRLKVPYQEGLSAGSAEVAESAGISSNLANELTLSQEELNKYSGVDQSLDSCAALEYTYEGRTRATNKVCINSRGKLYTTTEGANTKNPTFVESSDGMSVMLNINGNNGIGKTDWNGVMALNEFLGTVWSNACNKGGACNGYELTGNVVIADRGDEEWSEVDQTDATSDPDNEEGEKTCASSGAGGALGWILCPILENVSNAANDIYNEYVEPSLEMNADLFSGGDDGTRAAWEMFRNIANVAFIILLLVVIFSQLTGYGIDNYGIKKILPKLIVGVLLMNMSYLICVLCVDLSNIFGAGLKDMFDNLAPAVGPATIEEQVPYEGSTGRSLVSLGLLGVLGAGGAAAVIFNPAILLSLLVAAIGIGISIFFLFLLLSARQAAVVVLTVISPLAFAAFMLPNTKKYYDKWLKFMQVMLLVYPIAGLLVGGGNFVSSLLVSAAEPDVSFMTALTAMLVGVVPILFIPSVIKGSFAAFGSAGKALSGFGKQASGRATKFAKERDAYKNAQQAGLMRKTRIKAGYIGKDSDGNYVRRPRLGALISGGRRGQQRNALAFRKMLSDQGSLEATAGEDFLLNTQVANREEAIVANGENKDIGLLTNGLDRALRSNDKAAIYAYSNQLTKMGESGIEGVRRVYDGMFEQNGTTLRNGYSANAVKSLADHIVTDHAGTYKNSARSMFEVASSINRANIDRQGGFVGGSAMSTGHYVNSDDGRNRLMQKSKSATLSSMNDNEFDMTYRVPSTDDDGNVRRDNSGNIVYGDDYRLPVDDNERRVLGEQIYNALKNADSMDQNRVAHLRRMLHETGYSPETQTVEIVNGGNNNNGGHPYAVPPAQF